MGLKEWKERYYPVEAKDCPQNNIAAIEHAILKYEGYAALGIEIGVLVPSALYRHILQDIFTKEMFLFSEYTCALCHMYFPFAGKKRVTCGECPLAEIGECCIEDCSAYQDFLRKGDPGPMLAALRMALRIEKGKR